MEDKVLLAVVVSVLAVVLSRLRSWLAPKPKLNLPPGPWTLPLIGSIHHLVTSPSIYRAMRGLAQKHGPVMMLQLGQLPTAVMSSPEAAREVMKTNDINFADRHLSSTIAAVSYHGDDLAFAPYGERWRELRKICTLELFSAARVQSFRRIREEEVARMVRGLAASAGAAVDLTKTISRFINDTFVRESAGSLSKEHQDEYLDAFHTAVMQTSALTVADVFPSSRIMQLIGTAPRKALACRKKIERILEHVIREKTEAMARGDPTASEGFLSVLLTLQKDGNTPIPLPDETIMMLMFDMFGAGSETSSTLLNWCMTALVRAPAAMARAQAEVREALGGRSAVTEADIEGLSYLQMVIKETLRLYTPVPLLLPRMARETCKIMGYDIPKGTLVFTNVWAICRDPKYWDDPEEFRPERFENSSIDFKGTNYEFIPFGAGRRICPGLNIGVVNIELALASFLYHFDWKLPGGMEPKDVDVCEAPGLVASKKTNLILHPVTRISPPAAV